MVIFGARPFLHRNWVCSGVAGVFPDTPEALPGRHWTRSGPPRRGLQSQFWPKRHGGTPHIGKSVVKVVAFRTNLFFCRKVLIFVLLFNILCDSWLSSISLPHLGLLWRCRAAPPGAPGHAPGRPGVLLDVVQMPLLTTFWSRVQTGF